MPRLVAVVLHKLLGTGLAACPCMNLGLPSTALLRACTLLASPTNVFAPVFVCALVECSLASLFARRLDPVFEGRFSVTCTAVVVGHLIVVKILSGFQKWRPL